MLFYPVGIIFIYRHLSLKIYHITIVSAILIISSLILIIFNSLIYGIFLSNTMLLLFIGGYLYNPLLENKKVKYPVFIFIIVRIFILIFFAQSLIIPHLPYAKVGNNEIFFILFLINIEEWANPVLKILLSAWVILILAIYTKQVLDYKSLLSCRTLKESAYYPFRLSDVGSVNNMPLENR